MGILSKRQRLVVMMIHRFKSLRHWLEVASLLLERRAVRMMAAQLQKAIHLHLYPTMTKMTGGRSASRLR